MANEISRLQWSPVARFIIVLAAGVVVIAGLRAGTSIVAPLLLAIFLVILIHPLLRWLRDKGLPSWLSFLILFFGLLLIFAAVILFIYLSLTQLQANVPIYKKNISAILESAEKTLAATGIDFSGVGSGGTFDAQTIAKASAEVLPTLLSEVTTAFLVLLFLLFLLNEAPGFPEKARRALGAENPVFNRMATFGQSVRSYMKIRTISNLFVGITFTILLLILGVDAAFLWGFLAFVLSYIPTIGLVIASVPAIILALLGQGIATAVGVTIGILVLNGISDNYIAPRLSAVELELSMFVVFFSFVFWAWVLGPIGALLSAVLTVGIKTIFEAFAETHCYAILLGPAIKPKKSATDEKKVA